jgi:CheY-like chemotaxis protein
VKTAQVVLIEDNPADVELVKLAVREAGIECEIMLDLNTPRTDGFEVHLKLRQLPRLSEVPIAILTSSRARADKHRAALQGARYVEKPSQLQDFLTTVGELVKELLPAA